LHVYNRRDSFATKVLLANEEAVERIGTGAGTRYVQEDLNRLVALTLHHHPCSSTSPKLAPHSPNLPFILSWRPQTRNPHPTNLKLVNWKLSISIAQHPDPEPSGRRFSNPKP
jgi:hypothetical protein